MENLQFQVGVSTRTVDFDLCTATVKRIFAMETGTLLTQIERKKDGLEKEIIPRTTSGPGLEAKTTWIDNTKSWTGLSLYGMWKTGCSRCGQPSWRGRLKALQSKQ